MFGHTRRRVLARRTRIWVSLLLLPTVAACATRVSSSAPSASEAVAIPRPTRVLVTDFEVDPGTVQQDQGIGPRIQRSMAGGSPMAARSAIAREVDSAISETIVNDLRKAGLPAELAPQDAIYRPG